MIYKQILFILLPGNHLQIFHKKMICQPNKVTNIEHYQVRQVLSDSTAQAKVYLCDDGVRLYAIKVFFKTNVMKIESQFLNAIDSPHIVKIIEANESAAIHFENLDVQYSPIIVLEFLQGGNMFDMVSFTGRFPQDICRTLFLQLIEGLKSIHEKKISHRDIKPENILISLSEGFKLGDFGLSAWSQGPRKDGIFRQSVGTDFYWAPEVHRKRYQGEKSDIFSLGMMLFIMIFGSRPFAFALISDKNYDCFRRESLNDYWRRLQEKINFAFQIPQSLKNLFTKIFAYDSNNRSTLEDLKNMEWLQGNVVSGAELSQFLRNRWEMLVDDSQENELCRKINTLLEKYNY